MKIATVMSSICGVGILMSVALDATDKLTGQGDTDRTTDKALTAEIACIQQAEYSQNLSEHYKERARAGDPTAKPAFVITKEDCLELAAQKAAMAASPALK